MQTEALSEAGRQAEICNACRYCEGYCAVFPAMHRERSFDAATLTQLANLCHDCRGCYYACQYTAPHEFDLNLPKALAEARYDSWKTHAWPKSCAEIFERGGVVIASALVACFALIFALAQGLRPEDGAGFYAHMSHSLMVAIFTPAFVLPLVAIMISQRSYWRAVGGGALHLSDIRAAFSAAARLRHLAGGHGDGCNYEDGDRFTHARRYAHQAVLIGFLLCFASTASGTILHYGFGQEAPYGVFSLPKLLGLPGGVLLCVGTAGLAVLKIHADRDLGAAGVWGAEMAFVLLLFLVGATGLLLFAATGSGAVGPLLALHLGSVLTFFLLTPYSKMAHGFYRLTALTHEAATQRRRG